MAKPNVQQLLLQSSVSHDPSEIILIWWILLKWNIENVVLCIFVETMIFFHMTNGYSLK